jgi:hypothetical protein
MRPRMLLAAAGLVVAFLMLMPASATHGDASCKALAFGIITPVNPVTCDVPVTCSGDVGACVYDLYADTEAGGIVTMQSQAGAAGVTACGPQLGLCSSVASFTVPAGSTVIVHCSTGTVTIALMAELDCNLNPIH